MSRPEHQAPPEIYYGDDEARKYTNNSRYQKVQAEMSERAVELLALPEEEPCLVLDIGCGSGLSGEILDEAGHVWVGMDIAPSMLQVALERETEGDLFLADIGQGLGLRPGTFDGAISISVLQWLCNADQTSHHPVARLSLFFSTLYSALKRGSRAVFQLYPQDDAQIRLIMGAANQAGFQGGLVVDFPNSKKAKKFYLCLFAGAEAKGVSLPRGMADEMDVEGGHHEDDDAIAATGGGRQGKTITYNDRSSKHKRSRASAAGHPSARASILDRKARLERRGQEVKPTSKYTGRKRRPHF